MCWRVPGDGIKWDGDEEGLASVEIEAVPGACVIRGVLTPNESSQLIEIIEAIGFDEGVATGEDLRRNQSTQWLVGVEVANQIFRRLKPHLAAHVNGGLPCECGLNLRFRVYKYLTESEEFLALFDNGWEPDRYSWRLRRVPSSLGGKPRRASHTRSS